MRQSSHEVIVNFIDHFMEGWVLADCPHLHDDCPRPRGQPKDKNLWSWPLALFLALASTFWPLVTSNGCVLSNELFVVFA